MERFKISEDTYIDTLLIGVCSVCPAEFITEGRIVAFSHFERTRPDHIEKVAHMLPTKLSPAGTGEPTHYMCYIETTVEEMNKMVESLAICRQNGKTFCGKKLMDNTVSREQLDKEFLIIRCDKKEFLDKMGLKEIK